MNCTVHMEKRYFVYNTSTAALRSTAADDRVAAPPTALHSSSATVATLALFLMLEPPVLRVPWTWYSALRRCFAQPDFRAVVTERASLWHRLQRARNFGRPDGRIPFLSRVPSYGQPGHGGDRPSITAPVAIPRRFLVSLPRGLLEARRFGGMPPSPPSLPSVQSRL